MQEIIQHIGGWIAYIGVVVVLLGVLITIGRLIHYVVTGFDEFKAASLRHSLMIYLSLGLDFLIAKDVIVTLSLESGDYQAILQLAVVILIRILLSYFVHLEEKALHRMGLKSVPKKPRKKRA